jgi:hypothetical protein
MAEDQQRVAAPTKDKGLFCPACGGADVKASALAGGDASCNICNWTGKVEELATFHFSHDMGNQEQVFAHFFNDMRNLFSTAVAQGIGAVLLKWGFIDQPIDKKVFARYIGGIAQATVKSVLETRQALEKERVKRG